ncbi:MAG: dockerin type I domain-containing protein [Pirellulaceae bacterium]
MPTKYICTIERSAYFVNDTDVDASDSLRVTSVQGDASVVGKTIFLPSGALVRVEADGGYQYDPNGVFASLAFNETTTDSFTYQVSDANGRIQRERDRHDDDCRENDSPYAIIADRSTITRSVASGTVVGLLSTTDVDRGDSSTLALVTDAVNSPDSGRFAIVDSKLQISDTSGLTVGQVLFAGVQATDGGGATLMQVFPITVAATPVTENIQVSLPNLVSDDLLIRLNGSLLEVIDRANGNAVVRSQSLDATDSITITGSIGVDDKITIDFESGGFFALPNPIVIDGRTGNDSLTIVGNRATTQGTLVSASGSLAEGTFTASNGSQSSTIRFAGIEPLEIRDLQTLSLQGSINVGDATLTLDVAAPVDLGEVTSISGGRIESTSPLVLEGSERLTGFGSVAARVAGQTGSEIVAAGGDLAIGDAAATDGFLTEGTLETGSHTVTLLDANQAVLGSQTSLGEGVSNAGTLVSAGGLLIPAGNNVTGFGTLDTPNDPFKPFVNNGAINGASGTNRITVTGYLKGVGTRDNVTITGTDAPGLSPAEVFGGSVEYAAGSKLSIEIGGMSKGGQYDSLRYNGTVNLGGTLELASLSGFEPDDNNEFVIMQTTHGVTGTFADLPEGAAVAMGDALMQITYAGGPSGKDVVLIADTLLPRIVDVKVGSSDWETELIDEVDAVDKVGYSVPFDGDQLNSLTWDNLDRVFVKFSEDIGTSLDPSDITLQGVNVADYGSLIEGVDYDPVTLIATIRLSAPIGVDKLKITLRDSVVDRVGRALDGEFTTGSGAATSGDGTSGGAFEFRFDVLPADLDGDGWVTLGDKQRLNAAIGSKLGDAGFNPLLDVDGDGEITQNDIDAFTAKFFEALPDGEPGGLIGTGSLFAPASTIQVFVEGSEVVVRRNGSEISRTPVASAGTIDISGTETFDLLELGDLGSLSLAANLTGAVDTLRPFANNQSLDLTSLRANGTLESIEHVNLTGRGTNTLRLTAADLVELSSSKTLVVQTDPADQLNVDSGFRITETIVGAGQLHVIATLGEAALQVTGSRWTNPLNRFDINASGTVTPLDALVILNQLARRTFMESNSQLVDPSTLDEFPGFFFDTSANNVLTPLDALQILNFLNRGGTSSSGEAPSALSSSTTMSAGMQTAVGSPLQTQGLKHVKPSESLVVDDEVDLALLDNTTFKIDSDWTNDVDQFFVRETPVAEALEEDDIETNGAIDDAIVDLLARSLLAND